MAPFIRNISFHSINLLGLLKHDLAKASQVFQGVMQLFRDNIAKPVTPTISMPFSQIEEAFRLMQTGKHMGKIVLEPAENDLVSVRNLFRPTDQEFADMQLGHSSWSKANPIRQPIDVPPQRWFRWSWQKFGPVDGSTGC